MTNVHPSLLRDHHNFLERFRKRHLVARTIAAGNADVSSLASLPMHAALLHEQMRCLFDYEQSSVSPALTRLETQSHISRCRTGMIAARVRLCERCHTFTLT